MIGHIIRLHVFVTYEALLDYFSNVQVPRSKFEVVQSWILWLPETGWKTMVSFREVNACFVCRGHFLLFVLVFFFDVGRWELWMNFSFRISCFFYAVTLRGPWLFVTKVMKHPDPQTNGAYLKRVYPPQRKWRNVTRDLGLYFQLNHFSGVFRVNKIHHRKMGCLRCALKIQQDFCAGETLWSFNFGVVFVPSCERIRIPPRKIIWPQQPLKEISIDILLPWSTCIMQHKYDRRESAGSSSSISEK